MSATRDKSQKFKFDWDHNFYLLWKRGEFNTESSAPVVIPPKPKKGEDERRKPV